MSPTSSWSTNRSAIPRSTVWSARSPGVSPNRNRTGCGWRTGCSAIADTRSGSTSPSSTPSTRPAPYGHGAHPYLTLGRPIDECELLIPAGRYLEVDERAIPEPAERDVAGTAYDFREPRRVGATVIDNPFTGLRRDPAGLARLRLSDGERSVALWADEAHPWLEVYTLDEVEEVRRTALGAEPMTCPPNAFVTGTDLLTLEPGETVTHTWGIQAVGG